MARRQAGRRGRVLALAALVTAVATGPALAAGTGAAGAAATSTTTSSTTDSTNETGSGPSAGPDAVRPVPAPAELPLLELDGAAPDPEALQRAVSDELGSSWLGPSRRVGVSVRDVETGEHLLDRRADQAMTPASLTKLLTGAAVASTLPLDQPFTTRVVQGAQPGTIVLVAGGDMLLARGRGDHLRVAGHAGLADLAEQVAQAPAVTDRPAGSPLRLRVDLTHAQGPDRAEGWTDFWLDFGYTGPVTMLALAEDRALPGTPAPTDPAQQAAQAFRAALREQGVQVAGGRDEPVRTGRAPSEGTVLGEVHSAPIDQVLGFALSQSDNAMTEQLARQAAVRSGEQPTPVATRRWVQRRVAELGLDTTGVRLADAAGLSDGTTIPPRVLADLLVLAADSGHPELRSVVADLPIASYSGTLWDRFHLDVHEPAVGLARAKTGSLPGVTSLAGYVPTQDGRLLAFAIIADDIGTDGAYLEARSVIDEAVAELARCGC